MPKKVVQLKAKQVVRDKSIFPRSGVDTFHVRDIALALEAGVSVPPIVVQEGTYRLVDGWHRLAAWEKVYGEDCVVPVEVRSYESEAELFLDAMRLNAAHGQRLTNYDRTVSIARGQALGLRMETMAAALSITPAYAEHLTLTRTSKDGDVLKLTTRHFAGEDMTPEQKAYNRQAPGGDQLFYIRQVIALIESDAVDWDRSAVKDGLAHLYEVLKDKMHTVMQA